MVSTLLKYLIINAVHTKSVECRQNGKISKTVCGPFGIIMRLLKKPTRDEAAEKCPYARRVAPIRDWDCVREAALYNVLRLRLVVFSLRFNSYFARLALSLTRELGGGSEIKSESFCTFALYFARLALTLANKRTGGATIDVVTPLKCCLK